MVNNSLDHTPHKINKNLTHVWPNQGCGGALLVNNKELLNLCLQFSNSLSKIDQKRKAIDQTSKVRKNFICDSTRGNLPEHNKEQGAMVGALKVSYCTKSSNGFRVLSQQKTFISVSGSLIIDPGSSNILQKICSVIFSADKIRELNSCLTQIKETRTFPNQDEKIFTVYGDPLFNISDFSPQDSRIIKQDNLIGYTPTECAAMKLLLHLGSEINEKNKNSSYMIFPYKLEICEIWFKATNPELNKQRNRNHSDCLSVLPCDSCRVLLPYLISHRFNGEDKRKFRELLIKRIGNEYV